MPHRLQFFLLLSPSFFGQRFPIPAQGLKKSRRRGEAKGNLHGMVHVENSGSMNAWAHATRTEER
jgi:hypothetical protein